MLYIPFSLDRMQSSRGTCISTHALASFYAFSLSFLRHPNPQFCFVCKGFFFICSLFNWLSGKLVLFFLADDSKTIRN